MTANVNPAGKLDPAVLGRLMTAEGFLHVFPSDKKISEFAAAVIRKVPGVSGCRICLRGALYPEDPSLEKRCADCTDCKLRLADCAPKPCDRCVLADLENGTLMALESLSHCFGFLMVQVSDLHPFAPYEPFLRNFANHMTVNLENRLQRDRLRKINEELQKHRDTLETSVQAKTAYLHESEEKFSKAFQNAPLLMTITSVSDGRFLDVNDAFVNVTGYDRKKAIGATSVEIGFVTAEDRNRMIQVLNTEGRVREMAIDLRRADGSKMTCLYSSEPVAIEGQERLLSIATDITRQKKVEDALRESEERFRLAYHTSPDSINLNRLIDGAYIDINEGFTKIMGYAREEILGKTSLSLNIWKNAEDRKRLLQGLRENGYVENLEAEFTAKDGTVRNGLMSARVLKIRGEDIIISITRDITDRVRSEKMLRESKERLRKILDSQLDAIFMLDSNSPARVLECNKAAASMFGYEARHLIGSTVEELHVNHSQMKKFQQELRLAIEREGRLNNFEFSMKRKDGAVFPTAHTVMELKDDNGERTGWVSVVRDLTERKQMQKQLQQAQKMESIGNLAGGIAHDFNNILFPILGLSELLLEDLPPESPEHQNLQHILKAAERGSHLVQQILAFSRRSEQKKMPIRLQPIIKEVINLSRATIPANIEILEAVESRCGLIMADATQLHQVVMNLITNAYHAVEQTGGRISVQLEEEMVEAPAASPVKPGQYASLSISDTGCGIDPSLMEKIFEPYFTTKKQGKGTGLGLSVVYGIVREHGGDIKVHSGVGVGSTFNVYLPLIEKPDERKSHANMQALPRGTERILLVDDEAPIVSLLEQVLERLGYRVTSFADSVEAFDFFRTDPNAFDLLITDMAMPHMTGEDLARKILSIRKDIPVILCTGFSERISPEQAEKIGIKGFLRKPILKSRMAGTIREVLDV